MSSLRHKWVPLSPLVSRSQCGAVESLKSRLHKYQGAPCSVCFGQEVDMLCAVPLRNLEPLTGFLVEVDKGGPILLGVLERVAPSGGYATVIFAPVGSKGKRREFTSSSGDPVEFVEGGYHRTEWSAGTLVRPLTEEVDMSEGTLNSLVESAGGAPLTKEQVRSKVEAMKNKAASKVAGKITPKGKGPAPVKVKKEKEPRPKNECLCACGGITGGRFVPGHDARYYGWLKKVVANTMEFKELPKPVQKLLVDIKGVKKALAEHGSK